MNRIGRWVASAVAWVFVLRSLLNGREGAEAGPAAAEQVKPRFRNLSTGFGVLLIAGSLLLAWAGLRVASVPNHPPFAVAFGSPAPVEGRDGYLLEVRFSAESCSNPVVFSVTATPSTEFWVDNAARMPPRGRFAFGIEDRNAQLQDVGSAPEDLIPIDRDRLTNLSPFQRGGLSGVEGDVLRWDRERSSIRASFTADWLEHRSGFPLFGGRTCYLRLPALNGFFAVSTAVDLESATAAPHATRRPNTAKFRRLRTPTGIWAASNAVIGRNLVASGQVDPDRSIPSPTEVTSDGASWLCSDHASSIGLIDPPGGGTRDTEARQPDFSGAGGGGLTRSIASLAQGQQELAGCSAIAVIEESGAATSREVLLLLLGGVIAWGIALIARRPG